MSATVFCSVVLALCLPALSSSDPLFVLTAPNVLRVESEENVVIEAHDFSEGNVNVDISVQDYPAKRQNLYRGQTVLTNQNNYQAMKTIKIPAETFKRFSHSNQHVYLRARSPYFDLEKVVVVSFHSGYVIVQTDKTIYTPSDTVLYRVYALTHQLDPTKNAVSVEIMNPDGIIINREVKSHTSGISSMSYKLPEIVNVGIWKVVAKFDQTPQENFTTQFEVKEYVLPSFQVKLEPQKMFFYVNEDELHVDVTARYLYGEDVQGTAFVVFGVKVDGEKKSFPESLQRIPIIDGSGTAKLTRAMILSRFPNIRELLNQPIYISASVLTASGSDMVEAERRGIMIVTSPYKILFTKTARFFKPGMPFDLMVYVTNPDGSPAKDVPVEVSPGKVSARTQQEGTARLNVNTVWGAQSLKITVKTKARGLTEVQQAEETMVAMPYKTQFNSQNLLFIGIHATEIVPGSNLQIDMNLRNNDRSTQDQIRYFSYLILNKGKLLRAGRQIRHIGQSQVRLSLPVNNDMIPSFRFVAYYHLSHGRQKEVVSDSVWVDVRDSCKGTLLVSPAKGQHKQRSYKPHDNFYIKLTGDPGASVGLVAVDKAVYVLNDKYKLTQSKIWDSIEKNDIGCTAGGGVDNMGVFHDAGLMFYASSGLGTKQRTDLRCPTPPKRTRRSVILVEHKTTLASKYSDKLKKCCTDGMSDIIMDYSCEKRAQYIIDGKECVAAFLDCCNEIAKRRKEGKRNELELARSEEDDDYMNADAINSRTNFPESWFWKTETLPQNPIDKNGLVSKDIKGSLADSITTWEILAVSVSPGKGICVADPYEITVMQDFFIDLKLPYSVVRNEQVEIKAVLYNYAYNEITVRVELMGNRHVCSVATRKKHRLVVKVQGMSSYAVPFIIIPLHLGETDIEVKASVFQRQVSDGVRKKLRVVPEGQQIQQNIKSVLLNPSATGGIQKELFDRVELTSMVPNTEAQMFISVTGQLLAETIENAISGDKLGHLIQVPTGCGEQNMVGMTPSVIATHYLDKTEQWHLIKVERRAEAIQTIVRGYTQQLAFRKPDSSYSAFQSRPSSTWLTAYVVKVFSLAYSLIPMDHKVLCEAVKWLILRKQMPNGVFREDGPVMQRSMLGGLAGSEQDESLTGFVLIALKESEKICEKEINVKDSISKATRYLKERIKKLTRPYSVTMTSYALSLVGEDDYKDTLKKFLSKDKTHWLEPGSKLFTLEATAYGLLATLKEKDYEVSGRIVSWLTAQSFYGGGHGSTQATIMVFQAMAKYMTLVPLFGKTYLDVEIKLAGRSRTDTWRFSNNNAFVSRSEKAKLNQNFTVTAKGNGQGTIRVMTIYYAMTEEKKTDCTKFDLNVKVTQANRGRAPGGTLNTMKIDICMKYLGETDATMSILDITMLTGFTVDMEDLARLSKGVDRYIEKFELDKALSPRGSLIIYLNKVSRSSEDCISFRVHQMYEVGLIQPAAVTVYEYYSTENRCMKFYHPSKESGLLSKICQEDVCRCAEENCRLLNKGNKPGHKQDRHEVACEHAMDYVYKTRLLEIKLYTGYDHYVMQIVDVIKAGTDEAPRGQKRIFIGHNSCRNTLDLNIGMQYLIMGKADDLWSTKTGLTYILGADTWVERWLSDRECQNPSLADTCLEFTTFTQELQIYGCSS